VRDKEHLRYVASQPCLLCSGQPADAYHLRFAQPRALGRKVGDEFTVPLCRPHHRELHHGGNEAAWWHDMGIDAIAVAKQLWDETAATIASRTAQLQQERCRSIGGRTEAPVDAKPWEPMLGGRLDSKGPGRPLTVD
jgi:hypothetical protein